MGKYITAEISGKMENTSRLHCPPPIAGRGKNVQTKGPKSTKKTIENTLRRNRGGGCISTRNVFSSFEKNCMEINFCRDVFFLSDS